MARSIKPHLRPLTKGGSVVVNDGGLVMEYPIKLLKAVPEGKLIVHNRVRPVSRRQGFNGSRFWLQSPADNRVVCACGWALELGLHYRAEVDQP